MATHPSRIGFDAAISRIDLLREILGGTVSFGNPKVGALLRVTALQSLDIGIDPLIQQLKRQPAVLLTIPCGPS